MVYQLCKDKNNAKVNKITESLDTSKRTQKRKSDQLFSYQLAPPAPHDFPHKSLYALRDVTSSETCPAKIELKPAFHVTQIKLFTLMKKSMLSALLYRFLPLKSKFAEPIP